MVPKRLPMRVGSTSGPTAMTFPNGLISETGGQVHLFHVEAVIVHAFGPVKAHCFDLEQNFTRTGLALGQIFDMKDFGTTELVETDSFRHGEDISCRIVFTVLQCRDR